MLNSTYDNEVTLNEDEETQISLADAKDIDAYKSALTNELYRLMEN